VDARRPPLSSSRVLARRSLHAADVGAAQHGEFAAPRRLLRLPVGAAVPAIAAGMPGSARPRP
jgi:hypothetical protein